MSDVVVKTVGYRMCPWCRKPTVENRLEIWFNAFRHIERICPVCGYYRYT